MQVQNYWQNPIGLNNISDKIYAQNEYNAAAPHQQRFISSFLSKYIYSEGVVSVRKEPKSYINISTSTAIDFHLEGGREGEKKHTQLVNFLTLCSARLAYLFCGSRTRACLKSAEHKKKDHSG